MVGKELPHTHAGALQPAHVLMNVGAFTLGYTRDVFETTLGRIGIGGDATMYYVPRDLQESYGAPLSFHLFLTVPIRRRQRRQEWKNIIISR